MSQGTAQQEKILCKVSGNTGVNIADGKLSKRRLLKGEKANRSIGRWFGVAEKIN